MAAPSRSMALSVLSLSVFRSVRRCRLAACGSVKRYSTDTESNNTTHFGFENVPESEKQRKVDAVFQKVAEKYDVMNDTMSFGIHRIWKDTFLRRLDPRPGTQLIDVAGGTGDIAFRFLKYVQAADQERRSNGVSDTRRGDGEVDGSETSDRLQPAHVLVCDINDAMLNVGKQRAAMQGVAAFGISWQQGNAECLPLPDNHFDAYTIAFGIRNCTHIDKVLAEAYRVLKPGGRFMCLEFSEVRNSFLRRVYDAYSFQVIPVMGQVIASDWKSYQYLVESIRKFPNQEEFALMIEQAGFNYVTAEDLSFGIAAIHSGFKL